MRTFKRRQPCSRTFSCRWTVPITHFMRWMSLATWRKNTVRLSLVHAYPPIFIEGMMGSDDVEAIIATRAKAGDAILQRAVEHIRGRVTDVTTELREAPDAEAILEEVEAHHCDLVVMGTRGLGRLAGLLLGSVSQKVVQHAQCPVLMVR